MRKMSQVRLARLWMASGNLPGVRGDVDMSSLADRRTFVFLTSLLAIGEAAKAHPESTDADRSWWNRIEHLIVHGEAFPIRDLELTPKELARLRANASRITEAMARDYSLLVCTNVWITWCEDVLSRTRNPEKHEFFEELLKNLDGYYALHDPEYKALAEAAQALAAFERLADSIT